MEVDSSRILAISASQSEGRSFPGPSWVLATSRIVKIKDRGLREIIARTQAQRVERISFHLNGPTIKCGCEERDGATASRLSRRKKTFFYLG